MASKGNTQRLLNKYLTGHPIVVSGAPIFAGRPDGRWPVQYAPRHTSDSMPWVSVASDGFRYSSGEVTALPKEDGHQPRPTVRSVTVQQWRALGAYVRWVNDPELPDYLPVRAIPAGTAVALLKRGLIEFERCPESGYVMGHRITDSGILTFHESPHADELRSRCQ